MFQIQVKVAFLGAVCGREAILSALDQAVHNGHWLVLTDCHLLGRWDREVVVHLSDSISSVGGT